MLLFPTCCYSQHVGLTTCWICCMLHATNLHSVCWATSTKLSEHNEIILVAEIPVYSITINVLQ